MPDDFPTFGAGHNRPPVFDPDAYDAIKGRVAAFLDVTQKYLDLPEGVQDEQTAGALTDQIDGLRKLRKKVDDARKDAKKPHDDAGKEVQAAFLPLLERIDLCGKKCKALMAPYLAEQERRKQEAERKAREEAEAARLEAERKAREAAEANSIAAEIEAEQAAKAAEAMAKEAARTAKAKANVKSATGAGRTVSMRTVKEVTITNLMAVFLRYRDRPEVHDVLHKLVSADVRAADIDESEIPGIEITETKKAV